MPKDIERSERTPVWPLILAACGVILTWAGSVFVMWSRWKDWGQTGTIGDSFGAANALFSGLAFAGLTYAIYLQRNELRLQQVELEDAAVERERAAQALLAQSRYLYFSARTSHLTALISAYSAELERLNRSYPTYQVEAKQRADQIAVLVKELEVQYLGFQETEKPSA